MNKTSDLIPGFLRGEPVILQKLYTETYPIVKRYIMSRDGSLKDAEDIFHNALVLLFVKLKNEKSNIQSFENYLFIVCRNMWRRENKKKRVTNIDINTLTLINESVEMSTFYTEQNQWDLYQEKFKELSGNCQSILKLVFQKIGYPSIVKTFGYASETVARQRVFKCKSRLIQLIKRDPRYKRLKK
ncbi:MAG: sigma-70 family RNA polymerase sigma factor [Flavobacteriaceae bacterium]|nr:sigma-70 family RNA polymerase sigma factor [Flavobacteriaceae bacterium]